MPPSAIMSRSIEHKPPGVPLTLEQRTRSYEVNVEDVKPKERSVVAKINTWDVDRYKTSILSRGAILDEYRRNPIVLFEHGEDVARGGLPVGKNDWITVDDTTIKAKTIFRDDAFSRDLFECYKEGWLRGWSVRMVNPEYSAPTPAEINHRPELKECRIVYRKWTLGEYSAVVLPGNADTLTILTSRGIAIPARLRAMTDSAGGLAGGGAAVEPGNLSRFVKKIGDKWHVMSEEGKSLGEYNSEEGAKKRLQEIEYFKHRDDKSSGPRSYPCIIEEGGAWWIDEGTRRRLSFPSARLAQECLGLMRSNETHFTAESLMAVSLGDVRKAKAEMVEDVDSYIQLYTRGKI